MSATQLVFVSLFYMTVGFALGYAVGRLINISQ